MTLTSSSGGVYDYGLTVDAGEIAGFNNGQTITLSGLSGVTGASILPSSLGSYFTVSSVTSTSVVIAQTLVAFNASYNNEFGTSPFTVGTLEVDSTVLTTGPIDFSIETSGTTFTGTVDGPVALTAEPGSLALFTLALVIFLPGAFWVEQRRRRAAA